MENEKQAEQKVNIENETIAHNKTNVHNEISTHNTPSVDNEKKSESNANVDNKVNIDTKADVEDEADTEIKTVSKAAKYAERMKRLRNLHTLRNEARSLNHKEVVEEDRRQKLPANWEARQRQAEWIFKDEAARKEAEEKGLNYDRQKLLHVDAIDAERIDRKLRKKKNPDPGFSDFAQATVRQYNRLVKNMKPNMESYEAAKEKLGPAFYGDRNTILHGLHEDKKDAIDKMVDDIEKQIAKRAQFSRRRTHNDDADIDYINERNAQFNNKLERFYGEYTKETKLNLERGTAV